MLALPGDRQVSGRYLAGGSLKSLKRRPYSCSSGIADTTVMKLLSRWAWSELTDTFFRLPCPS